MNFAEKLAELERKQAEMNERYGAEMKAHETKLRLAEARSEVADIEVSLSKYESEMERAQAAVFDIIVNKRDFTNKYKDVSRAAMEESLPEEVQRTAHDMSSEQFEKFKAARGTKEWRDLLQENASDLEHIQNLMDMESKNFERSMRIMNKLENEYKPTDVAWENIKNAKNAAIRTAGNAFYEARIGLNKLAGKISNDFACTVDAVTNSVKDATDKTKIKGLGAYSGLANKADMFFAKFHERAARGEMEQAKMFEKAASLARGLGDKVNVLKQLVYGEAAARANQKSEKAQSKARLLGGLFNEKAEKAANKAKTAMDKYNEVLEGKDDNWFVKLMDNQAVSLRQLAEDDIDIAIEKCQSIMDRELDTISNIKESNHDISDRGGDNDITKDVQKEQMRYANAETHMAGLKDERKTVLNPWITTDQMMQTVKKMERMGELTPDQDSQTRKETVIAYHPELIYDLPTEELDESTLVYAMCNGEVDMEKLNLAGVNLDKTASMATELMYNSYPEPVNIDFVASVLQNNVKGSPEMSEKIDHACSELARSYGQELDISQSPVGNILDTAASVVSKMKEVADDAWDQSR